MTSQIEKKRNIKRNIKKEYKMIMISCILCLIAAGISYSKEKEERITTISRKEDGIVQHKELMVKVGNKEYPLELEVNAKENTQTQKLELLEKAKEKIENGSAFLGKNPNVNEISKQLNFPEFLMEGRVSCQWKSSPEGWIDDDGRMLYPKEKEESFTSQKVVLFVQLECEQVRTLAQKELTIIPFTDLNQREMQEQLQRLYTSNELIHPTEKEINLPESLQGKSIQWIQKKEKKSGYLLLLGLFASIAIIVTQKRKIKKEIRLRADKYQRQLPCFIQEMAVFLGAGLSVKGSFEKVAEAMMGQKGQEFLGIQIKEMLNRIKEGENELKAYQDFAEQVALTEYRRFIALIIQNIRKGTYQMSEMLNLMAREAYAEQLRQVRTQGEKVSTRLLVPMTILLCLVLVMVITPAIITNYR